MLLPRIVLIAPTVIQLNALGASGGPAAHAIGIWCYGCRERTAGRQNLQLAVTPTVRGLKVEAVTLRKSLSAWLNTLGSESKALLTKSATSKRGHVTAVRKLRTFVEGLVWLFSAEVGHSGLSVANGPGFRL